MNIIDEDIKSDQRKKLEEWRIHFRRVGVHVGWFGMQDRDDIIPLLHRLKNPTFFSCDHGFYRPILRHQGYCLVYLDVFPDEVADYIRRFLRHQAFRAQAQRMGKLVRLRHSSLSYWQEGEDSEHSILW